MKTLSTSDNPDINYLARVFRVENIQKHPNADKLQLVTIEGETVVTGLDCKSGDLYVHFTVESQIESKFLAWSNSFSDAERNHDVTKKGFFPKQGRVKIVTLRGAPSNGYIIPASELEKYIKEFYGVAANLSEFVGQSFDSVCGDRFVKKYVRHVPTPNVAKAKSKGSVKKYVSKLVEGQFAFHADTVNFRKDLAKVSPEDEIVIANKIHGSSWIVSKVLIKRQPSWKDKVAQWLGIKVRDTEYGNLYASRTVVKNKNVDLNPNPGFYDADIWKIVSDRVYPLLTDGVSLYGEVYGFTPSGKSIQPKYDYGCPPGQLDFIVYKGTITLPDGNVYVMSQTQLEAYCAPRGLKTDQVFYRGKAKDLFPELNTHNHWHENFLKALEQKFLARKCDLCKNDVWAEGIVIKIQQPFAWNCLKLKCFNFLNYETKLLDSEELSVEETEEQALASL